MDSILRGSSNLLSRLDSWREKYGDTNFRAHGYKHIRPISTFELLQRDHIELKYLLAGLHDIIVTMTEAHQRINSAKFDKMIELLSKIAGEPVKDDIPPEEEYEIANCEITHKGPWKGTWENCKIIKKNDDGTFNVKWMPRDINYCSNVPGHFIRKTNDHSLLGKMPHYNGMRVKLKWKFPIGQGDEYNGCYGTIITKKLKDGTFGVKLDAINEFKYLKPEFLEPLKTTEA